MTTSFNESDPLLPTSILKPSRFAVSRTVSGQALILDTTRDEIRQLNEVGTFIWSMITESKYTKNDILNEITAQFEINSHEALADLDEFLNELNSVKLLVIDPVERT